MHDLDSQLSHLQGPVIYQWITLGQLLKSLYKKMRIPRLFIYMFILKHFIENRTMVGISPIYSVIHVL